MKITINGKDHTPKFVAADNLEGRISYSTEFLIDERVRVCINVEGPHRRILKWDGASYFGAILHNPEQLESDIFSVKLSESKGVVGWIIPIQALCSTEHERALDEDHFVPIADKAYSLLLNDLDFSKNAQIEDLSRPLSLTYFFEDDLSVLILGTDDCKRVDCHDVEPLLSDLFLHGYWPYSGRLYKNRGPSVKGRLDSLRNQRHFTLNRPIAEIANDTKINAIFTSIVQHRESSLAAFLLYYQFIEVLIERILNDEAAEIIEKLKSTKDSITVKDALKKYLDISRELPRINMLFSNRLKAGPNRAAITEVCKELLVKMGVAESEINQFPDSFYLIRNKLVHDTKLFCGPLINELEKVNSSLETLAPELLLNFVPKKPPLPATVAPA